MLEFGRLITAMVTPFDHQLQVNWEQLPQIIDYLTMVQHSESIVVCGTTGESPTITEFEKLRLFEETVHYAKGRCKVIAGTGSNDTSYTIELSKKAEKLGVDALLIVAPYYNRPSQEGLFQHYKAIAQSVSIPIMLYNVPSRTGVNIDADTTIRLSKIPNIVATKDCSNLDQWSKIIEHASPGFLLYSGDDSMTLPGLSIGAYGVVSVASHVIGKEMHQMMQSYFKGENQLASELHRKLHPIFTGIFKMPNPVPIKHLLNYKGINVGTVRAPLIPLTEEEEKWVESLL